MSERKVLNKYYPPDFDPSKIPRLRLPKNRQYTVRIMAPCNMRCNTCGDYIARGKKFNARKETVEHEEYLGLKVFRFYFKCPRCMQEITFKTDPKNYDYTVEHGATPNFKALKLAEQQAIEEQKEKEEEERLNPMKLLENRTKASRREMENLEALEDLKEMNQREVVINYDELVKKKKEELEQELKRQEEEDEKFVKSIFNKNIQNENDSDYEDEIVEKEFDSDLVRFIKGQDSSRNLEKPSSSLTSNSNNWEENQNTKNSHCTNILNNICQVDVKSNRGNMKRKLIQNLFVIKKKQTLTEDNNKPTISTLKGSGHISSLCNYSGSESD